MFKYLCTFAVTILITQPAIAETKIAIAIIGHESASSPGSFTAQGISISVASGKNTTGAVTNSTGSANSIGSIAIASDSDIANPFSDPNGYLTVIGNDASVE